LAVISSVDLENDQLILSAGSEVPVCVREPEVVEGPQGGLLASLGREVSA
jgi:hypothetical protein